MWPRKGRETVSGWDAVGVRGEHTLPVTGIRGCSTLTFRERFRDRASGHCDDGGASRGLSWLIWLGRSTGLWPSSWMDWRRYPEQRGAVVVTALPSGTDEVVAAKMAAGFTRCVTVTVLRFRPGSTAAASMWRLRCLGRLLTRR